MVLLKRFSTRLVSKVHLAGLVPLLYLGGVVWLDPFRIDPSHQIMSITGKTALILLLLSLACSPIRTLTGLRVGRREQRELGLYAAFYAGLHCATFIGLDYRFNLELLRSVLLDSGPVGVGMAAGLILLLLAITSTQGWQRRLGGNWKRLHRLVYLAGVLIMIHFYGIVKDGREPLRYAAILALLLVLRLPPIRQAVRCLRRSRLTPSSNGLD